MSFFRFFCAALLLALPAAGEQIYDLAINNGRLIDPASNTDAVRSLGIRGHSIAAVSPTPLRGSKVIDAGGLVVAPGFIDMHSHGQTPENYALKAQDGVTTALEMEVGVWPVAPWYAARSGKSLINYGASAGYLPALMSIMHDSGTFLPRDAAVKRAPTHEEWAQVLSHIEGGLHEGALGIGAGIAYTPAIGRDQILDLFKTAAEREVVVFVHIRSGGAVEPGVLDGLQEVIADAAITGSGLHVVHITSMALGQTAYCLQMMESAVELGLDITTEAYPYTAGMTDLGSAIFAPGWQQRQAGISFGDLQLAATGEKLTADSFARYRAEGGGMVIVHSIPEEAVRVALHDPFVMVASDGIMDHGKGHPRAAGTFARVLGRYVREQHVLTLDEAIRKMTYSPAQRLGLTSKGRIAVGADADITIFDPNTVTDRATYEHPALSSQGFRYVLVGGVPVVKDDQIQSGVMPGQGIVRNTGRNR